ncbi:MAG TPA: lipocalin family protein [Dysgonamonadaceae bacterium]|jgi:heat shock protein HslJ|nr:lipocalin family protein [Dysgonamonadaceae bacterium]
MKTKTILLTVIALCLLISGKGCEKSNKITSDIIGTWKLVGFGNTADNSLKEAGPKDCDKCYTITFKNDEKIFGVTSTNQATGVYKIKGNGINLNYEAID